MIYGSGLLATGITMSYAQLVADSALIANIRHVLKGMPVDEENLAIDVIKQVGPGGAYIDKEHTFNHMRERSVSKLMDRTNCRENWELKGSKTLMMKAEEQAKSIITNHKPDPLPDDVKAKVQAILEDAEREFGLK